MDADAWDERYAASDFVWSLEPNRFVAEVVGPLPPGRAVDLACGEGRNALWLAQRGWSVTAVDFSAVALDKGRRRAAQADLEIDWVVADVTTWTAPPDSVDLVVIAYLQVPTSPRRTVLGHAARLLAPGGTLLVVAHDTANLEHGTGGPQSADVLYTPTDVRGDLDGSGLVIERAETVERPVADAERPALDCLVSARRPDEPER